MYHLFFPAIAVNDAGDIAIVMGRTGATTVQSIRAWARDVSAGANTAVTLIEDSETDTLPNTNDHTFGDYFGICVDPDGSQFWGFGEYMRSVDEPEEKEFWSTYIFRFSIVP